jgi:DNA-binding HxlR family transcriptional regulator
MDEELWHGLHDLLGRKWTAHVLLTLHEGPRGFNELQRTLPGLTAKVLSARLDALRARGFVERELHPTTPPRTTYRLTAAGERFADRLAALETGVEACPCDQPCVATAGCC